MTTTQSTRERWEKFLENTRLYSAGQSDYLAFIETEIANAREEALKEWEEKGRREMKEDMYDKLSEWHWTWTAMLDDYFKL